MNNKILIKNTFMLYLMTFAKLVLPLITLPYLTRVLTTSNYGVVTYTKSIMTYMQIIVDFGFLLSATKDIVDAKQDTVKISQICSDTLFSRLLLFSLDFIVLAIMCLYIPILKENYLYAFLSLLTVGFTCFLPDYLFRGLEIMHVLTYRFIISKTITTILTFFVVKNDTDLLLIPILDIIGTLVSILLTAIELKKLNINIRLKINRFKNSILNIKSSLNYFTSNLASTLLGGLSTILIGIFLNSSDVAFWGIANNLIGSIQSLYNPISDGIYPHMLREKNLNLIKSIFKIFLPLVLAGCLICYFMAPTIIFIIAGPKYDASVPIFKLLLPVLFISFPAIILGWPTLGAIGKSRETMKSTLLSVSIQVFCYIIMVVFNCFNIWNIAISRILCESVLCFTRLIYTKKFKNEFKTDEEL